jgi:hypothetical protein
VPAGVSLSYLAYPLLYDGLVGAVMSTLCTFANHSSLQKASINNLSSVALSYSFGTRLTMK